MSDLLLIGDLSLIFTSEKIWLIAILFLVSISLTWLYYRRTNPPLEPKRRLVLGLLRGIALTAIFFVFAEPLLLSSKTEIKEPLVAILADNSLSMSQNSHSGKQFEKIEEVISTIESRIGGDSRIVSYTLSDTIIQDGAINGKANVTAIGDCISFLAKNLEQENLQAVVLLSDGVSNLGTQPATQARNLGVPVYSVGFGSPDPLPDISIVDVVHNLIGFAGKEMPVEVVIESDGFEGLRLPVRLRHRGKTVAERTVDLAGKGRQQSVMLTYVPASEGLYSLEVSLPAQQGEQSEKNNSRQIQIKVRKGKIRILLAMAYLNWEYKFLKDKLSIKDDFEIDTYIKSDKRIAGTIPFPENLDALSEYDGVILNDFPSAWLTEHKQLLDAFFDRTGKGVLFLAGENFTSEPKDDYVTKILPCRFGSGRTPVINKETPLTLTDKGRIHPIMKLADDIAENQRRLSSLPPFSAYLSGAEAKPKAIVLAQTPAASEVDTPIPILSIHRYRNGKVALLSAFPFWKLDFLSRSFNPSDSSYAVFVENMILWLVARDDLQRIAIIPEKPIFIAGETVGLRARVLDESYQAIADAEVEAFLISDQNPQDSISISFLSRKPGHLDVTLHYLPSGNYKVQGTVTREGTTIGSPEASFIVEPYSLEDLSYISDFDMLKRISLASGGEFFTVTDTALIPQFPKLPSESFTERSEIALFDSLYFLLLFVIAVCVEWYLRRSYQLL